MSWGVRYIFVWTMYLSVCNVYKLVTYIDSDLLVKYTQKVFINCFALPFWLTDNKQVVLFRFLCISQYPMPFYPIESEKKTIISDTTHLKTPPVRASHFVEVLLDAVQILRKCSWDPGSMKFDMKCIFLWKV